MPELACARNERVEESGQVRGWTRQDLNSGFATTQLQIKLLAKLKFVSFRGIAALLACGGTHTHVCLN